MITVPGDRRASRARRGFSLLELVLALTLAGLVGVTALMMLNGMVVGTQTAIDARDVTVRRQVVSARLGAHTRSAAMVLAVDAEHLVLWLGDTRRNDLPDLSELRRIEWDAGQSVVNAYEAPDGLEAALDATFNLGDDFFAITAAAAGSPSFPGHVILQDITSWNVTVDDSDARSARLMRLRVTIHGEGGDDVATVISALRMHPG